MKNNPYTFEVPESKIKEMESWMNEIHEKYNVADGGFKFIFTPTGIGTICELHSDVSKTSINLTDYSYW